MSDIDAIKARLDAGDRGSYWNLNLACDADLRTRHDRED